MNVEQKQEAPKKASRRRSRETVRIQIYSVRYSAIILFLSLLLTSVFVWFSAGLFGTAWFGMSVLCFLGSAFGSIPLSRLSSVSPWRIPSFVIRFLERGFADCS